MILGSDVSEYRLITDWDRYVGSGRSFLAFKASGGKRGWDGVDPTLVTNLGLVAPNGPAIGIAYHFLNQDGDPVAQADHFLSLVPHKGVVLCCDFENNQEMNSFPTLDQLNAFVTRVQEVTGRWPWVYTTRGVWNTLTGGAPGPTQCPLWHAEWRDTVGAMYGGWASPVLWQYTNQGPVPGVSAPCDDNQLLGTALDLIRAAWGTTNVSAQDRGWGPPCPTDQIVRIQPTPSRSFNVHRRVAKIFDTFIRELEARGYDIDAGTLDDWSYNCRKISGSDSWSNHAWGLAVDINSLKNPMGSTLVTDMPAWVRDAKYLLNKYGLKWGGTFQTRPDAMHFEFILTPADADRLTKALLLEDDMFEPTDRTTLNLVNTKLDALRQDLTVTGTSGLEQTMELLYSRAKGADLDADKIIVAVEALRASESTHAGAILTVLADLKLELTPEQITGIATLIDIDEAAVAEAVRFRFHEALAG